MDSLWFLIWQFCAAFKFCYQIHRSNLQSVSCERVPWGRNCFFWLKKKKYTRFTWIPGLESTFEHLGTHPSYVPLLHLGKAFLQMIPASPCTSEGHRKGARQNPECAVRYLVWVISDYIWVIPQSLLGNTCIDDWWCSFALCHFIIIYVSLYGAPHVNANVVCRAFESERSIFLQYELLLYFWTDLVVIDKDNNS